MPVTFEIARQVEATLPSFQTALIDEGNEIGRIIDKFQGRCKIGVGPDCSTRGLWIINCSFRYELKPRIK